MTVKATFRPNRRSVTAVGNSNGVYRALDRQADKVERAALAAYEPHRKTGDYGRGFRRERTRIGGMAAVRLINIDPKAAWLEHGTRPHVIEPKRAQPGVIGPGEKKALAWPGGRHPVKRVNHPGTPALHLMRNALRAAGR